jgi:hypothetical protein
MQRAHISRKNGMHNYILMISDTNLSCSGQQSKFIETHKTRERDIEIVMDLHVLFHNTESTCSH